ncbi:inositol polyphosphate-4-phosphatase type I A-like isoform X2 [Physella acuta]|uniref:inositol polyphosphate-4-phosphatase type I A-like isoform X2 n=1 Tax=Physella acuta TaxID=109671 RepID=UPI0027DC03A5|nr:inositol polyphosphate-4-phosphatase type I A-like isoform X2 [Physella acuta]
MRFNSKELALLVQQTNHYDKEGFLLMKDKQDGFFKKSEAYINRYVKLKGNLLFYFKNKDNKAEPLGVIVLERCAVELAVDQETTNGFLLVFEGEDHAFRFDANSEAVRDAWIQSLHIASHECLKMQLQSLREQLHTKTGSDPICLTNESNSSVDFEFHSDNASQDPVLEVSISCANLKNDNTDVPPNALVIVHTMLPPQQQVWMHHNHSEIVEKNNNPQFLKTIGFGDKYGIDTSTRVRITVHHVVERMTGTMKQLGQAIFTLQDLLNSVDLRLSLQIKSPYSQENGIITITAWINDEKVSLSQLQAQQNMIQVSEYMAESKWTYEVPIQLLRLWVNEEKYMISMLQDLGELTFDEGFVVKETSDYCMSAVLTYNQHVAHLNEHAEFTTFKRSADKGKQELEFIPINLHIERMLVSTDISSAGRMYDISTVGAFSTHCRDMKNGGLRRLLNQVKVTYTSDGSSHQTTKTAKACCILNKITNLRTELKSLSDNLYEVSNKGLVEAVKETVNNMKEKISVINGLCADSLVIEASEAYLSAKRNANTSEGADLASLRNMSENQPPSIEQNWKWSGSNFVKSPTMEPWEVTRLNLEAAFVYLVSIVEDLVLNKSQECLNADNTYTSLLEKIKPAITKMHGFLEIIWARMSLFLTFLSIMENKGQVKQVHEIKLRRDIVNSHAISTLISAFVAVTHTDKMIEPLFCRQLCTVGIICQFEGLLSCYGSEMSMLEDTMIAVDDLSNVSFRLVTAVDKALCPKASLGSFVREGPYPDISRHNIIIDIPVPPDTFSQLPQELQLGKQITVTPVAFNIGINEQATLAEKFGSTALQEKMNTDSFAKVYEYYMLYTKHFDDPLDRSHGLSSLYHMIKMLQNSVMTKKGKNVDVLHMAAEVTRAMNGLRITYCKSGKDRTSMAVTLEMVHILQRNHNLASHVFMQSLDCLRSVGCRRENTLKNTGIKKYAFISLQMLYIPKLYRAPSGTYGNVQT